MSEKHYPQHPTEVTKSLYEDMAIPIDKRALGTFKTEKQGPWCTPSSPFFLIFYINTISMSVKNQC
jgi:hypothetical protein